MAKVIETNNLFKKFGEKTVINNLNLQVEEKDFFGLIGRNGAGKSTLINILVGLYKIDGGSFKLLNYDSNKLDFVKKEIGVMPDIANLYGDMNAFEFITYMAGLKGLVLNKKEISSLLSDVGLELQRKLKIKNYSFGMKKKISIAQAIIGEPQLVFLDEPTSGVDPESILKLQKLFVQMNKNGTTIFITSHNLQEIEKLCNKIAILKNGIISTNGKLDDIIESYKQNKVIIEVNCVNRELIKAALLEKDFEQNGNTICITYTSDNEIEQIVSNLVEHKIGIYSVIPQKATLEEIFLN